jgi:hypothetical protein
MTASSEVPAIVGTVVRYECPKCGNNCSCGVPYVPKTMRDAEALKDNPEKSNRAIAKEIGADKVIVDRARKKLESSGDVSPVAERVGLDDVTRKVPEPKPTPNDSADDPLVIENPKHADEIVATPWFASKIKPIIKGESANDPEKSALALRKFRTECALLLPQMTDNDLGTAENIFSVVHDLRYEVEQEIRMAKEANARAKRIKWEEKHPEEAKVKARERAQAEGMQDEMDTAKEDNRGSGESWGDIKDEWISDWIDNNWDEEREAEFEAEFQEQWKADHGGESVAA